MTLAVEVTDFQEALKRVRLVGTKGVSPVLISWSTGEVRLQADNLDAQVEVVIPALDGDLPAPILAPYDTLSSILNTYRPGSLRLDLEDHRLTLRADRAHSKLFVLDPETFPRRRPFSGRGEVVDLSEVWWTIRRVASAADRTTLDWIRDLFLHDGYAYATDKLRVHRCAVPDLAGLTLRLPGAVVNTVIGTKTPITELGWSDQHFRLVAADATWIGNLGNVEDVIRVAPAIARPFENELVTGFTVDRRELIDVVTRVLKLKIDEGNKFHEVVGFWPQENGEMLVRRHAADVGEHGMMIPYDSSGSLNPVGLNAHNLVDTLKLLECKSVSIQGPENSRQAWRTGDEHLEVAMMPVKVDD